MKLVCIDNEFKEDELTVGKIYEFNSVSYGVGSPRKGFYWVMISDNGGRYTYDGGNVRFSRFITLQEWREKQLDKLI
jgi:hypothetical protein